MHLSRTVASTTALACGACAAALAQVNVNTQVIFEASNDRGLTWGSAVDAGPGQQILVRIRVHLLSTDTTSIAGFAGITCQPTLSNWNPGTDTRLLFTTPDGTSTPEEPQTNTGRIAPFASSGMTTGSASGLLTSHVDDGNTLRFAGANAREATTNLAFGVSSGQLPFSVAGTNFRSGTEALIFRYAVELQGDAPRELVATVPRPHILQQRGSWYVRQPHEGPLAPVREEDVFPATIRYVPTPTTLTPLLLWPILASRRRRRPS